MSEPLFARFPRFDRVPETTPSQRLRRLVSAEALAPPPRDPEPRPAPEPEADAAPAADSGAEPAEADPVAPSPEPADPEEVKALIGALDTAIAEAARDAQAEAVVALRTMAETLFPALSDAFLAEEIVRHLRDWLPVSVAGVTITAPDALHPMLEAALARSPDLAARATLVSGRESGDTQVRVSWRTGGLDFDFDGLLAACLARLEPAQPRNGV